MAEYKPLEEEVIVEVARTGAASSHVASELAAEVLRMRRADRADSRHAQQIRRMRFAIEKVTEKLDELGAGEDEIVSKSMTAWIDDIAIAIGFVGPDGRPLAMSWQQAVRAVADIAKKAASR